jgi:hypothetical protein
MRSLDRGHKFELASYDGGEPQVLTFLKRDNPPSKYPGNKGHYPGTNIQEVLRAIIDRVKYLDNQVPCAENKIIINLFRMGLYWLEARAARHHGRELQAITADYIEFVPTCKTCGHVQCAEKHETFSPEA